MLTADLVRARRLGNKLCLMKLDGKKRQSAQELASQYLQIARVSIGESRETFEAACAVVPLNGCNRRLAAGLLKLINDRCEFEVEQGIDPRVLRKEVFVQANAIRQQLGANEPFDRQCVLREVAATHAISIEQLERSLYADLRSAHRLLSLLDTNAEKLVEEYIQSQAQAVLLRAVRVVAEVECCSPVTFRRLFHKLKFLQLLFTVEQLPTGVYRIVIDGPYSLFRSVTKYGLQLALAFPALIECDRWAIRAEVQWGKSRTPLQFELKGKAPQIENAKEEHPITDSPILSDEINGLLTRFNAHSSNWQASPSNEILVLPGIGISVPDMLFTHRTSRIRVYLELLGYWSREAVWRRVDLIKKGFPYRILFAVSDHLRVSEKVLDAALPGALYVFKKVMNVRAIEEKIDQLASLPVTTSELKIRKHA